MTAKIILVPVRHIIFVDPRTDDAGDRLQRLSQLVKEDRATAKRMLAEAGQPVPRPASPAEPLHHEGTPFEPPVQLPQEQPWQRPRKPARAAGRAVPAPWASSGASYFSDDGCLSDENLEDGHGKPQGDSSPNGNGRGHQQNP